jgi:hypothetical protein
MTNIIGRIQISVPEILAHFVGETILAKANSVELLSVLVNASSVILRSYSSFQEAVARRVAAALTGVKLVDQTYICTVDLLHYSPQARLRSRGIAEPC